MFTNLQYQILKKLSPGGPHCCGGAFIKANRSSAFSWGMNSFPKIAGKVVIDFGCGDGNDAVEMAGRGPSG